MKNNLYDFKYTTGQAEVSYNLKEATPVDARFVRTDKTGDKVYFLDGNKKYWVTTAEVLSALGGGFDEVKMIGFDILKTYESGEPLNMNNLPKDIPAKKEEVKNEATSSEAEYKITDEGKEKLQETIDLQGHQEDQPESAPKEIPEKGLTSIIIPAYLVNYPVFHMLGNCIGSIKEHTDKEKTPYEIIVILNGNDTAIKFTSLQEVNVDKVIVNEENMGFAYAVNQGIRCAKGEYIAVINDDVLVYDNWLEYLQPTLNQIDLVMATPMYGRAYARAVESREIYLKQIEKINGLADAFSDFIDFSCILTKKDLFNEVGLFNEDFFMYGEDLDFMRRMDKLGKKYASTKLVNTTHIIQGTANYVEGIADIMNKSKDKLREIWGY